MLGMVSFLFLRQVDDLMTRNVSVLLVQIYLFLPDYHLYHSWTPFLPRHAPLIVLSPIPHPAEVPVGCGLYDL